MYAVTDGMSKFRFTTGLYSGAPPLKLGKVTLSAWKRGCTTARGDADYSFTDSEAPPSVSEPLA